MKLEEIMNLKGKALAAKAAELAIPGRSKMSADELREAIASHVVAEMGEVTGEAWVDPKCGHERSPDVARDVPCPIEAAQMTGVRNESGIEMTKEEFDAYAAEDEKRVADAHRMYNSLLKDMKHLTTPERIGRYETFNYVARDGNRSHQYGYRAKLTPKQMRRVKHKANRHGEDFRTIDSLPEDDKGYALLARTPKGHGIFVKVGA